MARTILTLLIIFLSYAANGQKAAAKPVDDYTATDKTALALPAAQTTTTQGIADYINAHFTNNADKARAIFIWTASNIQYDVANMFAINFYESRQDKIEKALKTNKGICENYAAIFTDVAVKCGLEAYVVEGYTKQHGFTDYIPHAWCAARIDGVWYLFDPTWGSGYISNKNFIRKINNDYFKVSPFILIKSHMPFDPLWECLYYPITNQEFQSGNIVEDKSRPYFNYVDSIEAYEKETDMSQMESAARRVEGNGVNNSLVYDRLNHLKNALEINKQNQTVSEYNFAVADFNDAVYLFNTFIEYHNTQFKPAKTDPEIQQMMDTVSNKITSSRHHLDHIHQADAATIAMINSLHKSMDDVQPHIDEEKEFLVKYFQKSKMGRKLMFHKLTWMGVPIN